MLNLYTIAFDGTKLLDYTGIYGLCQSSHSFTLVSAKLVV